MNTFRLNLARFSILLLFCVSTASTKADVYYDYPTRIDPVLTITPTGGNFYNYAIDFSNTDTSPIWHFLVYTRLQPTSYTGSFPYVWNDPVGAGFSQYDARNLDPTLSDNIHMNYSYPATEGLLSGDLGHISFTLNGYYDSFLFGYETRASSMV